MKEHRCHGGHSRYLDYARNLPLRRVCSGDVPAADPQAVLSFS